RRRERRQVDAELLGNREIHFKQFQVDLDHLRRLGGDDQLINLALQLISLGNLLMEQFQLRRRRGWEGRRRRGRCDGVRRWNFAGKLSRRRASDQQASRREQETLE